MWILLGPIVVPDAIAPVGENVDISLYVEQNTSPDGATNVLLDGVNIMYFIIRGEKLDCQGSSQEYFWGPRGGYNHLWRVNVVIFQYT